MTDLTNTFDDSKTPYGLSDSHLSQMQSSHEQTLSSIKQLQQMEREMYAKLDTSTGNKTLTEDEQEQIINRINKLSAMRMNLFQSLKDVYTYEQGNVSETRDALVNQITTVKIVENELNNAKQTLSALEKEKFNKLRMVEINTYFGQRYGAQADVMKLIVLFCIPLLILAILMNKSIISFNVGSTLITLIIIIGLFFIGHKLWDISRRSNMNFSEYQWYWDPKSQDPTVIEYDKQQFEKWGKSLNEDANSALNNLGNAVGTCIGDACCSSPTKWDDEKHQCVEGFNQLVGNSSFNSRKDHINIFQNNGSTVMPYSNSGNYSQV